MKNNTASDDLNKSTTLGWKFVALVALVTTVFFTFLYLAMSSEPDYMPNRPPKVTIQHQENISAPQSSASSPTP